MTSGRKVVAVTGASGYIGRKLLEHLEVLNGLDGLVAFDSRPLAAPIHNIAAFRLDVSAPINQELADHRVTTLVHLAFDSRRGANRREVTDIRGNNMAMLRGVWDSCIEARVEHLVYVSSHTVYGAHYDNPMPILEDAPLRPARDVSYTYNKFLAELMLQELQQAAPSMKITILRPAVILGPDANDLVTNAFFRPWLIGISDSDPPLQFVYDDDLARVLCLVIMEGLPGVFNVAGSGVVYYREMAAAIQSRLINLPAFLTYPLARIASNLRIQPDATPGALDLIRWPILLSNSRLHHTTGYRFRHTAQDALTAFANSSYLYPDVVI